MNHSIISLISIALHLISIFLFLALSFKLGWLKLNHRSLFHQKLFWFSIAIPFVSFLYYGFFAWWGYSPDLSASGFETFYTISKVPLLFLAAAVPLASIVNNIHRTIQTEKQINEAERKNLSDSYYTHFKHTLELLKNVQSKELDFFKNGPGFVLSVNNPVGFYKTIFSESSYLKGSSYNVSEIFLRESDANWARINKAIDKNWMIFKKPEEKRKSTDVYLYFMNIYRIESAFERICNIMSLRDFKRISRPTFKYGILEYHGIFYEAENLVKAVEELEQICIKIFDIISPDGHENISTNPRVFLKRKIAVSYNGVSHVPTNQRFYSDAVKLSLGVRRQSGGTKDK